MLLLQGQQRVQPCGELGQTLRVGIETVALGCGRAVDVLEFLEHRADACGILPGRGVVVLNVCQGCFGGLEQRENARFVGVQRVAQPRESLADAVGILQYGQLLFELGLLACAELGGGEFLGLKAQPLLVAASLLGTFAQGCDLAAEFAHASETSAVTL